MHPQTLKKRIKVPAKGMLFGEYGVLYGYPAVAVTMPSLAFEVEMLQNPHPQKDFITIESSFFPSGKLQVPQVLISSARSFVQTLDRTQFDPAKLQQFRAVLLQENASRDEIFFLSLLAPFLCEPLECQIRILSSFSPALGFGSSSALLVAIHSLLANEDDSSFWKNAWLSLRLLQGRGSGYDIAVQRAALTCESVQLWRFDMPQEEGGVPRVLPVPGKLLNNLGLFWGTGCYSDTTQALLRFGSTEKKHFAQAHGELALEFLDHPTEQKVPLLMERSRVIAREQGILPSMQEGGSLARLLNLLEASGLSFKSMGAGYGDSLWICESEEKVYQALSSQTDMGAPVFRFSGN